MRAPLVGLTMRGRNIARHGYRVSMPATEAHIGVITSGAPSPTLGVPIAMAYVPPAHAAVGTMVEVAVRSTQAQADIVQLPFYKRS